MRKDEISFSILEEFFRVFLQYIYIHLHQTLCFPPMSNIVLCIVIKYYQIFNTIAKKIKINNLNQMSRRIATILPL